MAEAGVVGISVRWGAWKSAADRLELRRILESGGAQRRSAMSGCLVRCGAARSRRSKRETIPSEGSSGMAATAENTFYTGILPRP